MTNRFLISNHFGIKILYQFADYIKFGTFIPTYFNMPKPKRSADDYIHLNKKITDKQNIKLLISLSDEWNITPKEAAYRLLCESMKRERERRNR